MNYELCMKLKDAGFDQGLTCGDILVKEGCDGKDCNCACYAPTLEELIDACMTIDKTGTFQLDKEGFDSQWFAIAQPELIGIDDDVPVGLGKTPLEAVAKLYIKLNTK